VNRFQFVDDHQRHHGVKRLCQVIGIARPSYYHWKTTAPERTAQAADDARLAARIRVIHRESAGAYGVPRITAELHDTADRVDHKRVARVMRGIGLAGLRLRRRHRTTLADPAAAMAPDLLGRDFTAHTPNTHYVGSGSRRESHPPAPAEPCLIVSHYTALATLITRTRGSSANARTSWDIAA
jgi:hypothetical protein